ncbi:MAG: patatin-like phospholipase family protein [Prevotellaceae bacterium]|jgi:NTE family protein|nr:patatin-like phospholipase family protein [Prevotellaceae bacterium]
MVQTKSHFFTPACLRSARRSWAGKLLFLLLLLHVPLAGEANKEGIGVVLSGGAARGFAHLGALQALEDYGIVPTRVSGASMGAILGAVYAAGVPVNRIYSFAREQHYLLMYRPSFNGALFRTTFIEKMLDHLIPNINTFESLQKRMYVCITNLNTAKYEIIGSGSLKDKIVASASIPFVFEPSIIDSFTYVDGGLTNNLPVEPLLDSCKYIIGISVNSIDRTLSQEEVKGVGGIYRALTMVVAANEEPRRHLCSFYIEIKQAEKFSLLDFGRIEELYAAGYQATVEYIEKHPDIMKLAHLKN